MSDIETENFACQNPKEPSMKKPMMESDINVGEAAMTDTKTSTRTKLEEDMNQSEKLAIS
jgi:hypothetical protein